ncbi:MAG: DUF418 domain-containing protein [Acidobacteria bacterium]|nr:DUF418 domain-containing protein [Acidobacteriota bacterium]
MPDNELSLQNTAVPLQPVPPDERILALDVVRGFALFGVLLAYVTWNLGNPPEHTYSLANRILYGVLSVLVDTKFYTLFAFLFGLGFSIQLTRAAGRGVSVVPVYCRRLLALLLIGLAHALLLRNGDILVPYAVMGFFLLLFRNASNRTLAVGAIIGLVYPYLARGAWDLTGIPFPQRPEMDGASYLVENFAWVRYWYSIAITFWPASLPMFLFGLYVGRQGFFEKMAAHRKSLWRALVVGLGISAFAFLVSVLLALMMKNSVLSFPQRLTLGVLRSAHAWGLATFYVSSLLLLFQKPSWQRWLAPLGAVGRMALTNYLLQAAIIVPVCIGFDLFGRVTPSLGVLLALAVWSLQVPASVWWLRRFHFGPAEWLWRSLTYGSRQPMRMADESTIAVIA